MSRRVEITVPNDWAPPVRDILENEKKCGLNPSTGKPHMLTEVTGRTTTVFYVTIPGPAVSATLEALRKNGVGVAVGRVILSTIDYMKPDLSKPLTAADATVANLGAKKPPPLKGISHFQKARKTTEEMYNEISNGATMNINTWMNLIGASVIAAGGLTTGVLVFVVAAMLVSPIMGPILGMVMGYRVADFQLFKTGLYNEIKMAFAAYSVGIVFGLALGDVGNTYKWPNSAMMPEGQGFNLVISIIVSAAAGMVLGVSLTSAGGNALVGTAISAGLLPPLVNAGMLMSYSYVYAPHEKSWPFYEMGIYAILFYFSHVITIFFVANLVFWLKAINPRFKEGEDASFDDCPTLVEHRRLLEESGKQFTEREKAEFFFNSLRTDLQKDLKKGIFELKDNVSGIAHTLTGGMVGANHPGAAEEGDEVANPIHPNPKRGNKNYDAVSTHEEDVESGHVELSTVQPATSQVAITSDNDYSLPLPAGRSTNPSANVTTGSAAPSRPLTAREQVVEFYRQYNPEKLSSVDEILTRYQGKEDQLLARLRKQYNVTA